MRPELNQQCKEKLFALYYKQSVLQDIDWLSQGLPDYVCYPEMVTNKLNGKSSFLHLRSVDQLTDEEVIEIMKIAIPTYPSYQTAEYGRRLMRVDYLKTSQGLSGYDWIHIGDYLRSIGIATGFMGYSVEELIEAGWIKLKKDN